MTHADITIDMLDERDLQAVPCAQVQAWQAYDRSMSAACPESPFEVPRHGVLALPDNLTIRLCVARDRDDVIAGEARAVFSRSADREPLCQLGMSVHPDWRRRRIATRLVGRVLDVADAESLTDLVAWTCDADDGGEAFARRVDAEQVHTHHTSRLLCSRIDRDRMRSWLARTPLEAAQCRPLWLEGVYPDELIGPLLDLRHLVDIVPRGAIALAPINFSIERMREIENNGAAAHRSTLCLRHEPSGELVGFTEVLARPRAPRILQQLNTAVRPSYRGRGLGRWLKAAMLERVLSSRPEVEEIQSSTFATNHVMTAINQELGFEPFITATAWRVPVARVRRHLSFA